MRAKIAGPKLRNKALQILNEAGYYMMLIALITYFAVPHIWILMSAFNPKAALYLKFEVPVLTNFVKAFTEHNAAIYIQNSAILGVFSALLSVLLAICGGYALSRLKVPDIAIFALFLTTMVPAQGYMAPLYELFHRLGLLNTLSGCILLFATGGIPFNCWLMKNFFDVFPRELEMAAKVDGCNTLQMLRWVVVPMSLPPIGLVAAMSFTGAWGDFFGPLILLTDMKLMPISVGMLAECKPRETWGMLWNYGLLGVFSILYAIPPVLLFIYMQKYLKGYMARGPI